MHTDDPASILLSKWKLASIVNNLKGEALPWQPVQRTFTYNQLVYVNTMKYFDITAIISTFIIAQMKTKKHKMSRKFLMLNLMKF